MTSLQELKKLQEQKYLQHKEKTRLELEAKMLKEYEAEQEYDAFLDKLENTIIEIQNSKNITEIDFYVSSFKTIIETNIKYVECFKENIANKVLDLVNCVNNNINSKFNVTEKGDAAQNVINHVKEIMELVQLDKESIGFETVMDTTDDEELAKKLSLENSEMTSPFEDIHRYGLGRLERLGSPDRFVDSGLMNENFGKHLSLGKTVIGDISDFNALEDDLDYIQLAAFQNELMDEQ